MTALDHSAGTSGGWQAMQPRVPPQALDAERAVLGALLISPEAWPQVSDLLDEADFYHRTHGLVWRAIKALAERGRPHDAVTVGDFLVNKGHEEHVDNGALVVELAAEAYSFANVVAHAEIVAEAAGMRRLIEVGTAVVGAGFQPNGESLAALVSDAQQRLAELAPKHRGGLRRAAESLPGWFERFSQRYDSGSGLTGLPTQWAEFNDVTRGLQPATLYLVAARPSMGKSVFGLNLATFAALRGKTVGVFSLEMSADDCHSRNVAALARVPHDWVMAPYGGTDEDYLARMTPAMRDLRCAPLFLDDTPALTVQQFEARVRRMHQRHPLDLLVVDHLHDFRIDPKLARFEYGHIAQVAKSLGKQWQIPVVMLAQLNRNVTGRSDKRPTLADLRESGELEQKGDVIAFLHREDYYDTPAERTHLQGVVELHFAKGRNIRAGARIHLRNRFDQMRLDDWEGPLPIVLTPEPARPRGFGAPIAMRAGPGTRRVGEG